MSLAFMVCGLFVGTLISHSCAHQAPWWFYGVGAAAMLVALASRRLYVITAALGLATAAFAAGLEGPAEPGPERSGVATLTAEVKRTACGDSCWAEAVLLKCVPIDTGTCFIPGTHFSLITGQELPSAGTVTVVAKVSARPKFRNPSPALAWPDSRLSVQARVSPGATIRVDEVSRIARALTSARGWVRARFSESLGEPHAGIARALLLGEGNAVSGELNDAIRNAGVSHVLAVSGMHVTVLAGALVALVRFAWLRSPLALWFQAERAASALGVLLAPLVARFCGGAPSAWRAALASLLMYGLKALGCRPNALAVSSFAVLIYALVEPREAVHPGFVLSVLATSALLSGGKGGDGLWAAAKESGRAWLSTAPFLIVCFGTTSLIALVANVLLLPLGAALIPLVVAHLAAAALDLGNLCGTRWAFETASGAFVAASRLCSSLDPNLRIPPLTLLQGLCAAIVAAVWLTRTSSSLRLWVSVLALAAAGWSEWNVRHAVGPRELRVTFLDVGQGDSALLETGTGQTALIDAGGAVHGGPDPGAEAVLPLLRALRIRKLDLVVLSHPHPDHYGGLRAVLEAMPVAQLWDTGQAEAEQAEGSASQLLRFARSRGVRVRTPSELCAQSQRLGPLAIQVLSPCPAFDEALGPNDNSFVLRVQHRARSFLLTGDVEHETEAKLVQSIGRGLDSDVFKVPHHGSRTSSTAAFLHAVSPRISIVSAGANNQFGHPHPDVLERLRAASALVLRTDRAGGMRITSDGEQLVAEAFDPSVEL